MTLDRFQYSELHFLEVLNRTLLCMILWVGKFSLTKRNEDLFPLPFKSDGMDWAVAPPLHEKV